MNQTEETQLNTGTKSIEIAANVDVAVNIFAKPWQTALSLLSLHRQSGQHINTWWLQFEPVGSKFDQLSPYWIVPYLNKELNLNVRVHQPDEWQARTPADPEKLKSLDYRRQLRYGAAFEDSQSPFLFLVHNDVFIRRNLVKALLQNIGDAFAIGQLGQCWNCPASNREIAASVGCDACAPATYCDFRPDFETLGKLYKEARTKGFPARPYDRDNFSEEFEQQPWPLPECRINEWACLINMDLARDVKIPEGDVWPPGAYRECSSHNLDVVTPFFRDMHAHGFRARHFNIKPYMDHWIGTGNKSRIRYTYSEDRAKSLLEKFFPDYMKWLRINAQIP